MIQAFPYLHVSHLLNGDVCLALGDIPAARAAYEKALEIDPGCTEAWLHLVELAPQDAQGDREKQFAKMALDSDTSSHARANIEFALARIAEAEGKYDVAFDCFLRANRAKRQAQRERGVKPAIDTPKRVDDIIALYPREAFANPLPPLPIALRPVFIVGMPRSGTSLVEQILAAHPLVAAGGELSAVPICQAQLSKLQAAGGGSPSRNLLTVRERYVELLFENELDAEVVTDKLPGNFLSLGFIRLMFPDAVIVHCTRAPIATCWSIFTANLGGQATSYTSLEDLAQDYRQYRRLMAHWNEVLVPPMIEMRYEDLVRDPETHVRRLLGTCSLPWDERCLDFQSADHLVTTASAAQVRKPIYTSSVERWMRYEAQLAPLLASLAQP
jgi:tetratricopeptide (TPR) repeat protein